jgi:hypothetical protein
MRLLELTDLKKGNKILVNMDNVTHIATIKDGSKLFLKHQFHHMLDVEESIAEIRL